MKGHRSVAVEYEIMLQELLSAAGEPPQLDPDGYPNQRRLVSICILMRELLRNRAFGPLHGLVCCLLSDFFSAIFVGCSISKELLDSLAPPEDASFGFRTLPSNANETSGAVPLPFASMEPFFMRCKELEHVRLNLEHNEQTLQTQIRELMEGEAIGRDYQRRLRIEELEHRVSDLEAQLKASRDECEGLKREKRALMEGLRLDVKSLGSELERYQREYERAQNELNALRVRINRQDEARKALVVALGLQGQGERDRATVKVAKYKLDPDAERLLDQLYQLQCARVEKFDFDLQLLHKNEAPELLQENEGRQHAMEKLRTEFRTEIESLQKEARRLKGHVDEVRREKRVLQTRHLQQGLLRPDELIRNVDEHEEREDRGHARASGVSDGYGGQGQALGATGGPSSHSKLWSGYIMKCGANDDVQPRVPRAYTEAHAVKIVMDMLKEKASRDMVVKKRTTGPPLKPTTGRGQERNLGDVGPSGRGGKEDVGGGMDSWFLLTGRGGDTSVATFMYTHLHHIYGNHQVTLLVMHGLLTAIEKGQSASAICSMFSRTIAGDLDDATWHCAVTLSRILESAASRAQGDLEVYAKVLYGDMLHSDREILEVADVWGSALGSDVSVPRILNLLVAKLLSRQEMRYQRNLKLLRHIDKSARNSLNMEEFVAFAKSRILALPGAPINLPQGIPSDEREQTIMAIAELSFEIAKEKRGVNESGIDMAETVRRRALGARVPLDDLAMCVTGMELRELHNRITLLQQADAAS